MNEGIQNFGVLFSNFINSLTFISGAFQKKSFFLAQSSKYFISQITKTKIKYT